VSCCHSSANDADDVLLTLRVDDDHDPSLDRPDRDESILELGMICIEDLEIVRLGAQKRCSLCKGDSVLGLVYGALVFVPFELHRWNIRHWRSQSMA